VPSSWVIFTGIGCAALLCTYTSAMSRSFQTHRNWKMP
jgi:hypothetical protein